MIDKLDKNRIKVIKLSEAIVGLGGVLLGSVISIFSSIYVEKTKYRLELRREKLKKYGELMNLIRSAVYEETHLPFEKIYSWKHHNKVIGPYFFKNIGFFSKKEIDFFLKIDSDINRLNKRYHPYSSQEINMINQDVAEFEKRIIESLKKMN